MSPQDYKPVDQGDGECWIACLASLTGLPLENFPKPPDVRVAKSADEVAFQNSVIRYLRAHRFRLVNLGLDRPAGLAIATGVSPRAEPGSHLAHCVIVRDGIFEFDPHPSRAGLPQVDEYEILVPLVKWEQ